MKPLSFISKKKRRAAPSFFLTNRCKVSGERSEAKLCGE
jgi:hypothetical protein